MVIVVGETPREKTRGMKTATEEARRGRERGGHRWSYCGYPGSVCGAHACSTASATTAADHWLHCAVKYLSCLRDSSRDCAITRYSSRHWYWHDPMRGGASGST